MSEFIPFGVQPKFEMRLFDSTTFAPIAGIAFNSSGLRIDTICDNETSWTSYLQGSSNIEAGSLGVSAEPSANKCQIVEMGATQAKGAYQINLSVARASVVVSTVPAKRLLVSVSGAGCIGIMVLQLDLASLRDMENQFWDALDTDHVTAATKGLRLHNTSIPGDQMALTPGERTTLTGLFGAILPLARASGTQHVPVFMRDAALPSVGKSGTPSVHVSLDGADTIAGTGTLRPLAGDIGTIIGAHDYNPSIADLTATIYSRFFFVLNGAITDVVTVFVHL